MATVELRNITKIYEGGVKAVDAANIDVADREFLVLVGPSGCGKSTTLRMIAGLEEISSGELLIDGKQMNDVAPKDRDIAMVFQNYALYPHMSVYENMAFGLKIRKYAKKEIEARVHEAAGILDIEELLDRKPKALSGGQRQRVAVGRAIVRKPKVFLFDEPLSNLDAKLRVQMRAEISSLHSRLQATMIYVTHDQVEAMTMGDRIVVMRDGLIQQIGTPLGLYNQPNNRFVAGFIGSPPMNIMSGTVKEEGGRIAVDEGDFQLLPDADVSDILRGHVGREVVFGIRPEDLLQQDVAGSSNNITATVEVVEPLGSEIHLYVSTSKHQMIARVPPRTDFRVGAAIHLNVDVAKLHIFDLETEKSIAQGAGAV
jgi:multiple sugar transport system ATP-binding protein